MIRCLVLAVLLFIVCCLLCVMECYWCMIVIVVRCFIDVCRVLCSWCFLCDIVCSCVLLGFVLGLFPIGVMFGGCRCCLLFGVCDVFCCVFVLVNVVSCVYWCCSVVFNMCCYRLSSGLLVCRCVLVVLDVWCIVRGVRCCVLIVFVPSACLVDVWCVLCFVCCGVVLFVCAVCCVVVVVLFVVVFVSVVVCVCLRCVDECSLCVVSVRVRGCYGCALVVCWFVCVCCVMYVVV